MVAITADYRVSSRHQTKATACVEDGKSAVRWIRQNASKLGIDRNKVAAGGGSAGGHVAAAIATIDGFESQGEDLDISSRPDALTLFNPAIALDDIGKAFILPEEKKATLPDRVGTNPKKLSPIITSTKTCPPPSFFMARRTVPFPLLRSGSFKRKLTDWV